MNKNPYEVLVGSSQDDIEKKIKTCFDMGKFELVGPVVFSDGKYVATVKNNQYQSPAPKDPTN